MSTIELRELLINKIRKVEDNKVLEEVFRLLALEDEISELYILDEDQKMAVNEAREQIKNGQFLTNEEVNDEIDQWLGK